MTPATGRAFTAFAGVLRGGDRETLASLPPAAPVRTRPVDPTMRRLDDERLENELVVVVAAHVPTVESLPSEAL